MVLILGIKYANVLHGDIVWYQEVTELKAGLLTRRFKRSFFCERGAPVAVYFDLFTLNTFCMHKNLNNTLKDGEKNVKQ